MASVSKLPGLYPDTQTTTTVTYEAGRTNVRSQESVGGSQALFAPMKALPLLLSISLLALWTSSKCRAQSPRAVLHAGANVGLGGRVVWEDWAPPFRTGHLAPTYGGYAGVEALLHRHFTLGAEVGLNAWNGSSMDKDWDRQKQIDVVLRPLVPFSPVPKLELYGVIPLGITYCIPARDLDATDEEIWLRYAWSGGPGFSVGAAIGARFFFVDHFGLIPEVGYLYRKFKIQEEESTAARSDRNPITHKASLRQLQLRIGVAAAF